MLCVQWAGLLLLLFAERWFIDRYYFLQVNQVQEKQQQLTEQRHQAQQKDEQVREQLEQKRLAWQAAKSDREHYLEQLKELNSEPVSDLSIEIKEHQQKLEKAQQQFEKIGAVNLAASQEYEEVSQRFDELSHQMQDLQNTVDQLKDAMKKSRYLKETLSLKKYAAEAVNIWNMRI